jgi:hypothetical protein
MTMLITPQRYWRKVTITPTTFRVYFHTCLHQGCCQVPTLECLHMLRSIWRAHRTRLTLVEQNRRTESFLDRFPLIRTHICFERNTDWFVRQRSWKKSPWRSLVAGPTPICVCAAKITLLRYCRNVTCSTEKSNVQAGMRSRWPCLVFNLLLI